MFDIFSTNTNTSFHKKWMTFKYLSAVKYRKELKCLAKKYKYNKNGYVNQSKHWTTFLSMSLPYPDVAPWWCQVAYCILQQD